MEREIKKISETLDNYPEILRKRAERARELKLQATQHQQDAIETAEKLGDMKSIGIYMRLFKKYSRERLIACRDWILKTDMRDKGRAFVSAFHKRFK
ncbi:hypothetical protein IH981_03740 [Patescibacteria group bacterium]|nr:hypothetical protein [Patescibacteria group bacterium]